MTKNRKKVKKQQLFDPDTISTEVHQALWRDFRDAQHVYCIKDDLTAFSFNRQAEELLRKFCSHRQDKDKLEFETFAKFRKVNKHMAKTNIKLKEKFSCMSSHINKSTPKDEKIHLRARAIMHFVLTDFLEDEWFEECKNSPGSSIGVPFSDTSIERKFTFPMSVTSEVEPLFNRYMSFNWMLKEAVNNYNSQHPLGGMYTRVQGSRGTTVDKTTTTRRFICVEPTCNMFLQQGLMQMMYKRMEVVGLDVETLPFRHQELAKWSSVSHKDATIDWSSASDCVSIELLRWLLPPKWFRYIMLLRSSQTVLNGKQVPLYMISSMGNATTFPLETLVFWSYAHAVLLTENANNNSLFPKWEDLRKVSVFGDDCIVPTHSAIEFIDAMVGIGFIVNKEKSFYGETEHFRESCGGDFLAGYNVRPYNLRAPRSRSKSSLEPWLYIIMNSLIEKYMSYFGELCYLYDKSVFRYLFSLFRKHNLLVKIVPAYFPDDAGLKISRDIERFSLCYDFRLSRIKVDVHGSVQFNYLHFRYRKKVSNDPYIRYCEWLRKPIADLREPQHSHSLRRIGGYVVSKHITGHWSVPSVQEGLD